MKNGREICHLGRAIARYQLDPLVKIGNTGVAEQLRDRFDVPKIGQTFEQQIALLRKQSLRKIVAERFLKR